MDLSVGGESWPTSASLLAAIVDGSEDAIVSKALDGTILTWNRAAERFFGHSREEIVGRSISVIIPADRVAEEREIIAKIRRGERFQKRETIRLHKNGDLIDLSVTVFPVRAEDGKVVGATKIARDITPVREADRQRLVARELNHRIKNLFALTTSLVSQSAREAETVDELETDLNARLVALARAHDLTLPDVDDVPSAVMSTSLLSLLEAILAPYRGGRASRVSIGGTDVPVGGQALISLALVLHELATNAIKYGSLSAREGHVDVDVSGEPDAVHIVWTERGGPKPNADPGPEGFGSGLERVCAKAIGATLQKSWGPEGLVVNFAFPLARIQ